MNQTAPREQGGKKLFLFFLFRFLFFLFRRGSTFHKNLPEKIDLRYMAVHYFGLPFEIVVFLSLLTLFIIIEAPNMMKNIARI
jgi:hypothetical protein